MVSSGLIQYDGVQATQKMENIRLGIVTNVSCQLKVWPFASCQLNLGHSSVASKLAVNN